MSNWPLISIGGAMLWVVGLNPQRLGTMSEARVPGTPTWLGMDYQATGLGEAHTRLEVLTYPHVVRATQQSSGLSGGLDTLQLLQQIHEGQQVVNYYRMYPAFLGRMLGQVRVRHLFVDETHLHPFDGIGRKVAAEIDLLYVGGP